MKKARRKVATGHAAAAKRAGPAPAGHIDHVGSEISGWAFDPAVARAASHFSLLLDDVAIRGIATIARPDVMDAGFATYPLVGFSIRLASAIETWRQRKKADTSVPHSIALAVAGIPVARTKFPDFSLIRASIDSVDGGVISGSVVGEITDDFDVEIEFLSDEIPLGSTVARRQANSLPNQRTFKFSVSDLPFRGGYFRINARVALTGQTLANSPVSLTARESRRVAFLARQVLTSDELPDVSIIVPVFNAADDLQRCLESVIANTTRAARLILVDDASTDARIAQILSHLKSLPNVQFIRNDFNRGFAAAVNAGIRLAGEDDVVLLNSDALVTPRWLEGLRIAASSHPAIGSVTPLSDNAGAFSVPEPNAPNATPEHLARDEVGRLITQESATLYPETPTGNGFCMYIRRACLDEVGEFNETAFARGYGEENDFSMRALRSGWRHVVDDRTFVFHTRSASFGKDERDRRVEAARRDLESRYPEYSHLAAAFARSAEMALSRFCVRRAYALAREGRRPLPRLLTVVSSETGGTPLTNRDLAAALADDYEVFLLRSDRERVVLSRLQGGEFVPIAEKQIEVPITLGKHFSSAYDNAVAEFLIDHAIEIVHIRHIAWHGMGLTWVCRKLDIPIVFSFHDFYTICPALKLLDERHAFCGGTCTASPGPCVAELWEPDETPTLKHSWVQTWRAQTVAMLEPVSAFVTTSESAKRTICVNIPEIGAGTFRVIPHGRDFHGFARAAGVPRPGEALRLLAPGNLSVAKGAQIIAQLAMLGKEKRIEIHTVGRISGILERAPVVNHGPYEREGLLSLIEDIRPHFGLVLSIWPETFCHTLTELWAAGVPTIAFDQGAIGERIRDYRGGFLVPTMKAESVLEAVLTLSSDKARYHQLLAAVIDWQMRVAPNESTAVMAAAYRDLYDEILDGHRPFRDIRVAANRTTGSEPAVVS